MRAVSVAILALTLATAFPLRAEGPAATEGAAAPVSAVADPESAGTDWRPDQIKRPQDFAPARLTVAERDTAEFRKPGSLLSKMSRVLPKVDTSLLTERKLAMYEGERFYRAPLREGGEPVIACLLRPGSRRTTDDEGGALRFGWVGWSVLAVVVGGTFVAWMLGWFVPFSQRNVAHTSKAASVEPRNREARVRGPKIELVKRGA